MFMGQKLTFFAHTLEDTDRMMRTWDFIFCLEMKVG